MLAGEENFPLQVGIKQIAAADLNFVAMSAEVLEALEDLEKTNLGEKEADLPLLPLLFGFAKITVVLKKNQ